MVKNKLGLPLPELTTHQLIISTLVVGVVVLGFWLLFRFHQVILLLIAGIIISTALRPVVQRLKQRGLSPAVSVLLIFGLMLVVLGLFLRFVAPLLADQATTIGEQLTEIYAGLRERLAEASNLFLRRLAEALPAQPGVSPEAPTPTPAPGEAGVQVTTSPFQQFWGYVALGTNSLYKIVAVFFIAFFWTIESERIKYSLILLLPINRRDATRDLLAEMEQRVGSYVSGQLALSVIIGGLSLAAYLLIGLPYALALALFVGIMEVIPVIGPLIGAVPSIIIAATVSPLTIVWVIIASLVIHQLEANVFGPRVMKRALGLRPLVTLVALTAFGTLFGVLGALIALPLAAVIQLLLDRRVSSAGLQAENDAERDQLGRLRYDAQELIEDVRKVVRKRETTPEDPGGTGEYLEDTIEAIALDLDKLLAYYRAEDTAQPFTVETTVEAA
jgi:predicted PurR-regulated permease PerM